MADDNHSSNRLGVDNRFAIIPHWVILSPISDGALRLYAVLMKYADNDTGTAFPARSTLARDIRKSQDTVDRYIKELEKAGALRVRRRVKDSKENWTNLYTVVTANPDGAVQMRPPTRMDAAENYTHLTTPTSVSQHPSDAAAFAPVSQQPAVAAAPWDDDKASRRRAVRLMAESLQQLEDSLKDETQCDTTAMDDLEVELGLDRIVGNDMVNTNIGEWLIGVRDDNGGGSYGNGAALNAYIRWATNQPF